MKREKPWSAHSFTFFYFFFFSAVNRGSPLRRMYEIKLVKVLFHTFTCLCFCIYFKFHFGGAPKHFLLVWTGSALFGSAWLFHPSILEVMRSIPHCDVGRSGVWLMSRASTLLISDCGGCGEKEGGEGIMWTARKWQMEPVSGSVTCDRCSRFNETCNSAKESSSTR